MTTAVPTHTRQTAGAVLRDALRDYPRLEETIRVKWNGRLTRCAGRAHLQTHVVELSGAILPHVPEEDLRQTVLHELAHLIAFVDHGHAGHGDPWKLTMLDLGAPPSRTHDLNRYPAVIKAMGLHLWACRKCGHVNGLSNREVKHREAKSRRGARFLHRRCGGDFYLMTASERAEWLAAQ